MCTKNERGIFFIDLTGKELKDENAKKPLHA
jgi:hypothetical protein